MKEENSRLFRYYPLFKNLQIETTERENRDVFITK